MLSLDVKLLETHNLSSLITTGWFAAELAKWQAHAIKLDSNSYDDTIKLRWSQTVGMVEDLLTNERYIEASQYLLRGVDDKSTGLIQAIQFSNVNLVMACLALGLKVNDGSWDATRHPLTEAMILNSVEIFNLLLLVPGINVNIEAAVTGEYDDISQFLGMGEQFEYYRPVEFLLSAAYAPILASLSIDTEKRYGSQRLPLMVHAYRNNNIRLMNWLVFCGAEINPRLNDYYGGGPNLINLALFDYLTYKDERHTQLLKWFSRFAKLMVAQSELNSRLMQDLIESAESDAPELIDWFDLESFVELKHELGEDIDSLTLKHEELQAELTEEKQKLTALVRKTKQHESNKRRGLLRVSLLEELKRVHRIEVSELLEDIFVEVQQTAIVFGFSYSSDLVYLEVQTADEHHIEELLSANELLTYSEFHLMLYFLSLPERFWFKLSLLAEMENVHPFKSIDGNYLVSQTFAESFLGRVATSDINSLDRNEWQVLYKYLHTLATEVDVVTGNLYLAKVVEDLCRDKIWTAPAGPCYFTDFPNQSLKDAESKVFEGLKPMFEQIFLTVRNGSSALFN